VLAVQLVEVCAHSGVTSLQIAYHSEQPGLVGFRCIFDTLQVLGDITTMEVLMKVSQVEQQSEVAYNRQRIVNQSEMC
jgi:hypothetical protein